jgi:hypothetical protein
VVEVRQKTARRRTDLASASPPDRPALDCSNAHIGTTAGFRFCRGACQAEASYARLNRYPTLRGYCLVAPKRRIDSWVHDLSEADFIGLQRVVHRVAKAIAATVPTERLYSLSLGTISTGVTGGRSVLGEVQFRKDAVLGLATLRGRACPHQLLGTQGLRGSGWSGSGSAGPDPR